MRRVISAASIVAALVASARVCRADTKVELLVIGNNRPPAPPDGAADPDPGVSPLRFADDDAAAFYELFADAADDAHLLTVMDRDTQSLYPQLVALTRPPNLRELRAAIAASARRIEANRLAGHSNVLFVFFSGHGSKTGGAPATLALLDGGISQQLLYDEILSRIPADYVHVIVDACHAEAVVRPRDAQAQPVKVADEDANALLVRSTLARFPNVGAIVASTSDTQAHEWDRLRHGVFTHELLSALRGAADVNQDGRIEYSEVYAFLSAANRGVSDARARLDIVARPPDADRRVPLVDRTTLPRARVARVTGVRADKGLVELEDSAGRTLVSLRGESGFVADLSVPPAATLYVRAGGREARVAVAGGQTVRFDELVFEDPGQRPRGALEDALRRGLFATGFGRSYYAGFIDQAKDFVAVSFAQSAADSSEPPRLLGVGAVAGQPARAGALPWLGPATLIVGGGASTTVARGLGTGAALRLGLRPRDRDRGLLLSVDLLRAGAPGVSEWQLGASVGWLWARRLGPGRGWLGAAAGGGAITQSPYGGSRVWSGVGAAGPEAGLSIDLPHSFGLWMEAQLFGLFYRREDRVVFSAAPAAWAGVSLGL